MVKAVIYTRLSKRQTDNSFSLEVQEEKCREFANNLHLGKSTRGLDVINVVQEVASAYTLKKGKITKQNKHENDITRRDKQAELLNILQTRKRGDYIIVARPDRLSRDVAKLGNYLDIAKKRGLTIIVLRPDGPALYSNCNDDVKILIELVREAAIESKNISQRVKATNEYKKRLYAREGWEPYNGRVIPYGKMVQNQNLNGMAIRVLVTCPSEQELIQRIKNMTRNNCYRNIIAYLNNAGLLRRGEKWTLRNVLDAVRIKFVAPIRDLVGEMSNIQI